MSIQHSKFCLLGFIKSCDQKSMLNWLLKHKAKKLLYVITLVIAATCTHITFAKTTTVNTVTHHHRHALHSNNHIKVVTRTKVIRKKHPVTHLQKTPHFKPRALLIAPDSFIAPVQNDLVAFVRNTVTTLHYSRYKLGGARFDTDHGVYIVDCSSFVDHILRQVSPHAYSSLVNYSGSYSPATQHYYDFFADLNANPDNYWNAVDNLDELKAGDILVFRKKNARGHTTSGHVMVVMKKPVRTSNAYMVRVADSAPARHSEDTRKPFKGGIGIGTLLLRANPKTGKPAAYAWGVGGSWKKNTAFAMARPMDVE